MWGIKAYEKYLVDLVGEETLKYVRAQMNNRAKSVNSHSHIFVRALDAFRGKIMSAMYVPLQGDNPQRQDCRYFLSTYLNGGSFNDEEVFDARGAEPRVSRWQRRKNPNLVKKLQNWESFSKQADQRLGAIIRRIPFVFLPLNGNIPGFNFDQTYEVLKADELRLFEGRVSEGVRDEIWREAYELSGDAVVVDSNPVFCTRAYSIVRVKKN